MSQIEVPKYEDLLWPTLEALIQTGGSASNEELSNEIAQIMDLSEEVIEFIHTDGATSKVDYNAAWARTHLKYIGAVENSSRGVWSITDRGRAIKSDDEVRKLVKDIRAERQKEIQKKSKNERSSDRDKLAELEDLAEQPTWEERLLSVLRSIEPAAFERLCQRVLRESGFIKVEVTGKTGDGGIDGTGILRVNLLSFRVMFQCKRYAGSVPSAQIRDFRGAMIGRADKGLFITTGRFTRDAERESVRDGAPAIDLIDGNDLCRLLKDLGLGIKTETVESVSIERPFFESL